MTIEDLAPEVRQKLEQVRYDDFDGKHEGPWNLLVPDEPSEEQPEFLLASGFWILLPRSHCQHLNITFERVIESRDGQVLTIFLRDTSFLDPGDVSIFSGYFVAICEKFPGQDFFVARLFHERYFVEPLSN